jgi:uncharacterized protein YndB with AHSA1/START domain
MTDERSREIARRNMSDLWQKARAFVTYRFSQTANPAGAGGGERVIITMDGEQRTTVRVTRRFGASRERVFDAWLDAKTAGKWLFATATGRSECVEIDARSGGWFYIVERREGENVDHIGEYIEGVRPRRLVFTLFAEKYSLQFERVTVLTQPLGSGCELELTHETKAELATRVRRCWIEMLDRLAAMLGERGSDAAPPARGVAGRP